MASVEMKFVNRTHFLGRLLAVVPEAEKEIAAANQRSAQAMVDMAKRLAPFISGALHDSIRMAPGERPGSWIVRAGGTATTKSVRKGVKVFYDYSLGIEFGHKSRPGGDGAIKTVAKEPFFWPAYRAQKRPMKARVARAMSKAIKAKGFGNGR
jgi:hypothetical protein